MQAKRPSDRNQPQSINVGAPAASARPSPLRVPRPCAAYGLRAGGGLRAGVGLRRRARLLQSRPHHRQSVAEPLSTAARSRPLGALCFGRAPRAVRRSSPPPFGPPPLRWRRPCPLPRNKQQRIFLSPRSALYAPPSLAPPQKGLGAGRFVRSARRDRSTVADRPFLLLSSAGACVVGAWGGQSPRASSPPPAHLGRR